MRFKDLKEDLECVNWFFKKSENSGYHQVMSLALKRITLRKAPTFDVLLNSQLNQNAFLEAHMMSSDMLIEMFFPQWTT